MKQLVGIALALMAIATLAMILLPGGDRTVGPHATSAPDAAPRNPAPRPSVGSTAASPESDARERRLAVPSEVTSSGPSATGRLVLLDDSGVAGCAIWAVAADSSFAELRRSRSLGHGPPVAMAHAVTDDHGDVELVFAAGTAIDQEFRLWHGNKDLPQSEVLYRLSVANGFVHRLPAGRLSVLACDVDGLPVAGAMLSLQGDRGRRAAVRTAADGSHDFYLTEPQTLALLAYHETRHIGSIVEPVEFAPHVGARQRLTLDRMDTGAVRVEVVDPSGSPVEPYAVRVKLRGQIIRFVLSDQLRDGLLTDLPEVEVELILERPYSDGPAMFLLPEQGRAVRRVPDQAATAVARFTVELQSRIGFDVQERGDRFAAMAVRVRSSGGAGAKEWRAIDVEHYEADRCTVSNKIRAAGRWYTEPLEPGFYEIEVRKADSPELVLRDWISLTAGATVLRNVVD